MPVSGVMVDKTRIPLPLSLPSTPARSSSKASASSISSLSSIPSFSQRTSTISSSKTSTSRVAKPPTPITPVDGTSMRDQAHTRPSSSSSNGTTTANRPPSASAARAEQRAERAKSRSSVRDVGTSSSSNVASSPRTPKVYPKSISVTRESAHRSTPSQSKSQGTLNANNNNSSNKGPSNPKASSGGSGSASTPASARARPPGLNSRTPAPTAARPKTGPTTESGPSDADQETDNSNSTYITPPSSPDTRFKPVTSVVKERDRVSAMRAERVAGKGSPTASPRTAATASARRHASSPATNAAAGAGSSSPHGTPALPILPTDDRTAGSSNEPLFLSAMLHGRNECEILRACAMPDKAIQRLKGIVYGDDPAHLRGMNQPEIDTLKRALALYDFYWFTKDLNVDLMTAFVDKVTYGEMKEIAEDEGYMTEDEASPVAVFKNGQAMDSPLPSPRPLTWAPKFIRLDAVDNPAPGPAVRLPPSTSLPNFDDVEDDDEDAIPAREARANPRVNYLDPQARHLRALGRRCASGAALLAAAKIALHESEPAKDADG